MGLREVTPDELAKILERHKLWLDTNGAEGERANLRGADLDFSSLPLWCGGLRMKTDRRIMAQIAYHFCNQDCSDPDYLAARNAILDFANSFHRVEECGELERIEPEKEREEDAGE